MIAAIVCYTGAIGVVLAAATCCVERALLLARRPVRSAWMLAIVASTLLPPLVGRLCPAPRGTPGALAALVALLATIRGAAPDAWAHATIRRAPTVVGGASPESGIVGDRVLGAAWTALAAACLVRSGWRALRTRHTLAALRAERRPRVHAVGRARVVTTATVGPAVLGGWRATVAVPRWVRDDLDATDRRLVFAHEAEHVRAGDVRLIAAADVLVALVPWSPAVWWMAARLRAAVELDCDRRVLARRAGRAASPVGAYGRLLLAVAARDTTVGASAPTLATARAAPSHTTLERRIRLMTTSRPTHSHLQRAALAVAAVACVAVACEVPRPTAVPAATATSRATVVADTLHAPAISVRGDRPLRPGLDSVLVVIDGRIAGRGHAAVDSIPVASIATMDVLKGPVATQRFGPDGRWGVVVVTRGSPPR